ncbi:M48 family metalloprotease [Bdellovibrio bacteriovorus]|uniref:M48 family metalloprotease n=1 Tax=Bdellovibrio bacteriovorus TaxID=959 RepID=UPI0021D0E1DB|nr:M48 family metalloprotease [Bdellovibrio bacteriovorus]UXR65122.1 M48 family metalloprotease [Bdellovibrio bacteriovorus]
MRWKSVFAVKVVLACLMAVQAQASVAQYVSPDYYLGQLVRGILMAASQVSHPQFKEIEAPEIKQKAEQALHKIYQYPAFKYRYDKLSIIIIQGLPGEPNGFSFGNNMFLTKSIVEALSSAQLTAVIAHELAHSEKAHNMQKTPLPLGAAAYQLKTIYDAVKAGQWPAGRDLVASMQDLLATSGLAMELQADCVAAQQLEHMNRQGLPNSAADLNSATSVLMGFDITTDTSDDPSAVRAQALVNKVYEQGSCDIF